jgi:hypothetical protein
MAVIGAALALPTAAGAQPDSGVSPTQTVPRAPPQTIPLVQSEHVNVSGERPRPDGPVQASVADEELARWNVGGTADPHYPSNKPGFHVAPRVMVDTTVRAGWLPVRSSRPGVFSETAVLAQTRNKGYWPFRLCFEAGLRQNAKLRGKSRLHFVIDVDGRARASRLVATELTDIEVARCVAARAGALKFAPPPRRRVPVELSVELSPGDAPLPELRLAGTDPPDATPRPLPVLDGRRVEELLLGALATATACFASRNAVEPFLWGRIGLRVDVDRHGNVTVKEHESRFPDAEVVRCTAAAVQALPIANVATGPASFTWAVRFGSPPPPTNVAATNQAENKGPVATVHSAVAESPAPRLPLER